MRTGRWFFLFLLALEMHVSAGISDAWHWLSDDFEVLMNTNGQITFAPYLNGRQPRNDFAPGYRSDFYAYVDFFKWKGLVSNWLIANSTIIESSDSSNFKLHRIRYTLTPGYRYEFDTWLISGLLLHECIHEIDHGPTGGSIWWNSFRFGFGSKAAYQQFLVERYRKPFSSFLGHWDYQINAGVFLHKFGQSADDPGSIWLAQNNDYRYEEFSLLRYYIGRWGRWGSYADLNNNMWYRANGSIEQKWSINTNLLLRGRANIAALYCNYVLFDNNNIDNENGLAAAGFKIVF
ncbi:MAG TPA: hypothetical protein DCQ83_07900 [Fibrobacteres bacterium]|jgi:hypothetical protein|nr:hypothetical protein [Fibrobacterota bacterium]